VLSLEIMALIASLMFTEVFSKYMILDLGNLNLRRLSKKLKGCNVVYHSFES
jgi:hypothetical protein